MADLRLGETCTYAAQCISNGTAETFTFPFQVDKVTFYNMTQWTATAGKLPVSVWIRNITAAGHASQQQVIDSAAGSSFNFLNTATNGFTVADTTGGVPAFRALISAISGATPAVVTTTAPNSFQTGQIARFTDLGDDMPVARGASDLNNNRYRIVVLSTTTFAIYDPVTDDPITLSEPYVSGGRVDIESRVISLNNPQQPPYTVTPYQPNPFEYDPVLYKLTVGTAVMGNDDDVIFIEAIKYGEYVNLGDFTS